MHRQNRCHAQDLRPALIGRAVTLYAKEYWIKIPTQDETFFMNLQSKEEYPAEFGHQILSKNRFIKIFDPDDFLDEDFLVFLGVEIAKDPSNQCWGTLETRFQNWHSPDKNGNVVPHRDAAKMVRFVREFKNIYI